MADAAVFPVQGVIREVLHAGERRVAYVRIPMPEGAGRKTALVTIYDPPEAFVVGCPAWVQRGETGRWELA